MSRGCCCFRSIHDFHIDYNAPWLSPKVCIAIVFDFSWDDCNTQEKLETMVLGGNLRCIMVNVKMANSVLKSIFLSVLLHLY